MILACSYKWYIYETIFPFGKEKEGAKREIEESMLRAVIPNLVSLFVNVRKT